MQLNLKGGGAGGRSNLPVTRPRPRPQQGFFFFFLPWNTLSLLSCALFFALPPAAKGGLLNLQGALFVSWHRHEWQDAVFRSGGLRRCQQGNIVSLSAALVVLMLRLIGTFVSPCVCVWVNSDTHTHTHTRAKTITPSPFANVFANKLKSGLVIYTNL